MVRWLFAGLAGGVVAVLLFALMHSMVAGDAHVSQPRQRITLVDFIDRPEAAPVPEPIDEKPPPPEQLDPPPSPEPIPLAELMRPQPMRPPLPANTDFRPSLGGLPGLGRGSSTAGAGQAFDQPLLPLQRIPPTYPRWAAQRRLEGWVKVAFTVDARGQVSEAEVVAAEPSGVFDQAALRAIRQWRFQPPTRDGEPVAQRAVQILKFKLEGRG